MRSFACFGTCFLNAEYPLGRLWHRPFTRGPAAILIEISTDRYLYREAAIGFRPMHYKEALTRALCQIRPSKEADRIYCAER